MQRRATAIYVAFFLVVGAVSFTLIATASPPELSFENPEYELQENETFTINGVEFRVQSIEAEMIGGGHGAAAHLKRSAVLVVTNESAVESAEITVNPDSDVTLASTKYFAHFPNNQTLVLTQAFDEVETYREETALYHTHRNGLWAVTVLSGLVVMFMIGAAYLPSRY